MWKHFAEVAVVVTVLGAAVMVFGQAAEASLASDIETSFEGASSNLDGSAEDHLGLRKRRSVSARGASVITTSSLWPAMTVTYQYGSGSQPYRDYIDKAIRQFELHTCLRFREENNVQSWGDRIVFTGSGQCSARVGRGRGAQECSLGPSCNSVVTIMQLIANSVGVYPEHVRYDRNQHVVPIFSNVDPAYNYKFTRLFTSTYGTPYDYISIMQLGPLSFTRNGHSTLNTLDPFVQGLTVVNRTSFSFMDKRLINSMYGCIDKWVGECNVNSTQNYCQNDGYVGPDCSCECPAGTMGDRCENRTSSYTEALVESYLPFNELLTSNGTVESPFYPDPQNNQVVCTKYIAAPQCNRIVAKVEEFQLAERCSNGLCCEEALEIRRGDPVTSSQWTCGSQYSANDTIVSEANTLVLFYAKAKMENNTEPGFRFQFTFEPISGCVPQP